MDTVKLPSSLVMGWNDTYFLGDGWYSLGEGPRGVAIRWCQGEAHINVPAIELRALEIIMIGREHKGRPIGFGVYLDRERIGWGCPVSPDRLAIATITLERPRHVGGRDEYQSLRLVCEFQDGNGDHPQVFIPDALYHNGDYRELGLQLAGIRFY